MFSDWTVREVHMMRVILCNRASLVDVGFEMMFSEWSVGL